ncbi:MAG: hypothetical protein M3422_27550 [Actinomycetota bacterium]|nr:hypothetical protein [Actinomycetota bacterium]
MADATNAARRGDTGNAWRRMGLRSLRERAERYAECVTRSTGQVQQDRPVAVTAEAEPVTGHFDDRVARRHRRRLPRARP